MRQEFDLTWEAEDGYAGKSRPQYLRLTKADFEDCKTLDEVETRLFDMVREDFEGKITWYVANHEDFMEWAANCMGDDIER